MAQKRHCGGAICAFLAIICSLAPLMKSVEAAGMQCKGFEVKEWENEKNWRSECMKEDPKSKSLEESFKNPCFRKCMVMKRGIVDEAGMPKAEKATEFAQMTLPKEVHGELSPKYVECVTIHGPKIKDANGSCESYAAICLCMEEKFKEVCGGK